MEKEFVPYELALKLKQLGFDEPCLCFYNISDDNKLAIHAQFESYNFNMSNNSNTPNKSSYGGKLVTISAPTFSQAFRWFRDNHGLCQIVIQNTDKDWTYEVMAIKGITYYETLDVLDEYEEAEIACLEKLIEIVTEKQ